MLKIKERQTMNLSLKELNQRDKRILTRSFLQKLMERVNENEDECVESLQVFEDTGLHGYSVSVLPYIVEELSHQGLVVLCDQADQVRITRRGKQRLQRTVENNAYSVLETLAIREPDSAGRVVMQSKELQAVLIDLTPGEINDAISILEESGFVTVKRAVGTHPYTFYSVLLTSRGRYQFELQLRDLQAISYTEQHAKVDNRKIIKKPTPAGSPYGLTDIDWSIILGRLNNLDTLYVVLGHQFESKFFSSNELRRNIEEMFYHSIEEYERRNPELPKIELKFKALRAEYGQHLFNTIAKDIISADIAVFEASDLNPNVMIEIGVALTWGVTTLIIREQSSSHPPSDISGHPWAAYTKNASIFETEHNENLLSMLEFVLMKKRSSY